MCLSEPQAGSSLSDIATRAEPDGAGFEAERMDAGRKALALKTGQTQLFIETPYRNAALWQALLQALQPGTRLAVAAGLLNPAIPAGLLGGAGLYTRPVQGLLNAAIATRPQQAEAVRNALMQASPGFVPAGAQVGLGLLEY